MRGAFTAALVELAARDRRVLLLTGDLGYTVLEPFADRFPDRFFNVGVAEQNMIGLATGLAEAGYIPYAYSIATFVSLRAYEFVRNGPVLHRLPVRIVGVGGGFDYGSAGSSHHGLEDIGVMRLQPGLTVVTPADSEQARAALLGTWNLPGPVYYRLGKAEGASVPGLHGRFRLGRAELVREGRDVVLVCAGAMAVECAAAAEALTAHRVSAAVLVVASVNPAPVDDLAETLARFPVALSVEAHYVVGGIGSLVSEVIAEKAIACRLVRCGVGRGPDGRSGSTAYLNAAHGLSAAALVETARRALASAS